MILNPYISKEQSGVVLYTRTLVSRLYLERSLVSVALRSPWVSAPRLSNLLATTLANLCSPDSLEMRKTYSGAFTWFDLWVRPEGRREEMEGVKWVKSFLFRTLLWVK